MQNTSYCFLIADDHFGFRDGMNLMLSRTYSGCTIQEATTGTQMLQMALHQDFSLIFCDIEMPGMNGIEATKKLIAQKPESRIIAVSMHNDFENTMLMFFAGACGYFCKNEEKENMQLAIQTLLNGGYYVNGKAMDFFTFRKYMKTHEDVFAYIPTVKEMEVLKLMAEGMSTKMIAPKLNVSIKTIEAHRHNLFIKTNKHSASELLMYAKKRGWV